VQKVEPAGPNRVRLFADRDVRPEAAAQVIAAGGKLYRLSIEEPSLELIYARYFESVQHQGERNAA
jgi:ABC-2 type transport system ATP-binding protein